MKHRQDGAAAVEFALVAALFITLLLGLIDFGRILFIWNAAAEATRLGARTSVVCDIGATRVLSDMQQFVPVTTTNVQIDWYDGNGNISTTCTHANCAGVAVSIKDLSITPFSPLAWIGFSSLSVPGFSTYLSREIMGQDPGSSVVCN